MKPYYVLAFSGGKDSTYLLYEILRRKMPLDEIRFFDTGLEFPVVYEWLDVVEKKLGVRITRYPPRKGFSFEECFFKVSKRGKNKGKIRGFPATILRGCWISRDCKVRNRRHNKDERIYIGYNCNERKRIQKDKNLLYPLIDWGITEKEIVKRLTELDLMPTYYKLGFRRGGCWLCPKQSSLSLKLLWKHYPLLWEKLKYYEKLSPMGFRPNSSLIELEKKFIEESKQMVLV